MTTPAPPPQEPEVSSDLAAFIRTHQREILEEWQARVRELPAARKLDRPALLDHVPDLLGRIADLADEIATGRVPELPRDLAERHAVDRLDEGFDLAEVVLEYSILRDCIMRRWESTNVAPEVIRGMSFLGKAIDRAVTASVERYTYARDRTLQALDRISVAALESQDLDELLRTLLAALVETTAAADTAVILLRDGELLRARAAVGLEQEVAVGLTIRIGEGFAGTIAAERRPRLLRAAGSDALVQSDVPRARGLRALYGVPLVNGGELIGVAHIGSLSAFDFSDQDKRLLVALSNRATTAVSQHMLREALEKRAEELRLSEARLQSILDHAPVAIYIKDVEGRCVVGNPRLAQMLGRSIAELSGQTDHDLFPRDAADRIRALDESVRARGAPVVVEESLPMPDGVHAYLSVKFPVPGPDGQTFIGGISTDITERKRAEEDQRFLQEATAVLASSLDYRETLSRLAKLAVPALADWCNVEVATDDGRLELLAMEHADPSRAALVRELRDRYPHEPGASHAVARVLATGQPELHADIPDEVLASPGLADRRELRSAMIVPMLAHGRTVGTISLFSAESGRRYTQRDLAIAMELAARAGLALENARLYREAQDAVRAREVILAVVSHDLRNPLGAIMMSTALLAKRSPGPDAGSRKHLEMIQRSAERMAHLIDDLLDLANIQAGRLAIGRGVHDGQALIDEALDLNEQLAAEKGIEIERACELGDAKLLCDPDRVLQVFANLLGNAVKFGRRGDRITVRAWPEGGHAHVLVSDTGPGIPAAELPHVFEPYWSGKSGGANKKGTGLGLYITRGIIESHGGRISVESTEGAGTSFRFTLPLASPG